jgi:AMP-binding enzyme
VWLYAEIKALGDIPRHYGRSTPDRMALLDSLGRTSFAELDVRSNRIANVLLDLNITPGARVAFLGKNTTRYFEILFGVNKAGAALRFATSLPLTASSKVRKRALREELLFGSDGPRLMSLSRDRAQTPEPRIQNRSQLSTLLIELAPEDRGWCEFAAATGHSPTTASPTTMASRSSDTATASA